MSSTKPKRSDLIDVELCPFTVAIDTREQAPFTFSRMAGLKDKTLDLVVPCVDRSLKTGDYSIDGLDGGDAGNTGDTHSDQQHSHKGGCVAGESRDIGDCIVIERKSLDDLWNTLSQDGERFERELSRMQWYGYSAVVIEGGWGAIEGYQLAHPERKMSGEQVMGIIRGYTRRYPKTHWFPMLDRRRAEVWTFRLLYGWWREKTGR